jgi:hypothetical protein
LRLEVQRGRRGAIGDTAPQRQPSQCSLEKRSPIEDDAEVAVSPEELLSGKVE